MSTEKAMERICGRMGTLADLHARGIVQGALFRKQMRSLLASRDAGKIFTEEIESDRKAIKIMSRLEDPDLWRELSMKSRDEREESFYDTIGQILDSEESCRDKVIRMLQLACLPYFTGFLPLGVKKPEPQRTIKPSRVSVLD